MYVHVSVCVMLCCVGIIQRQQPRDLVIYQLTMISTEENRKSDSWAQLGGLTVLPLIRSQKVGSYQQGSMSPSRQRHQALVL